MKKTLALLLSALAVAGTVTAATADTLPAAPLWEENVDYLVHGEMNHPNYPGSLATGLPEVTTGQLLKGTVISSMNALDGTEDLPMSICDGDAATSFALTNDKWIGIILDQAYELTEVRAVPNSTRSDYKEEMGGFTVQGSNDGEHWLTILQMGQVAHGTDYHIFTPQTVTDQRYIDAGYDTKKDESIHWMADGGSFQYYRMTRNFIADVELYGNPAPATELNRDIVSALEIPTPYYFPGNYFIRTGDQVLNSVDGSLVGTIIGGGGVWNRALYDRAFNTDNRRAYDPVGEGPRCWVGMMFDEPHALTEVRIMPKRNTYTTIAYGRIQGSLDGHNWVDLVVFSEEDVPTAQEWISKPVTDPKGYTHFRYTTAEQAQASLAGLLLFGAPAEAAEPFTVEPLIATRYTFSGELHYADTKNTVTDTEISGTPVCGKYYDGWLDYGRPIEMAFDGNLETYYGTLVNGTNYWVGLKADTVTTVTSVKFHNPRCDSWKTLYFQGSVDGHSWVDLAEVKPSSDARDAEGWITKTVTDANGYSYFRLLNDKHDYPACYFEVNEIKIYGEEYVEIPETEAPKTEAPETAVPETAVPETEAPETEDPNVEVPFIAGDINRDGAVDISDAMALFQHSMLPDIFPIDYAETIDFDANGTVDINDAMRLFQYSMLPDMFPLF